MNTLTQIESYSNPLQTHIPYNLHSHNDIGCHGEKYAAQLFRDAGYIVRNCSHERHSGDICIVDPVTGELLKIEVKTAIESHRGRYGFCLIKAGHTSIKHSDFVLLLCIDKHGKHYSYLIPTELIFSQHLTISSNPETYRGKYAPFRVRGQVSLTDTRTVAQMWGVL